VSGEQRAVSRGRIFLTISSKLLAVSCKPETQDQSPMSISNQLTMVQLTINN